MMQQVYASPSLSHWLSQASPQPPSSSWANSACAAWGYAGMHNLLRGPQSRARGPQPSAGVHVTHTLPEDMDIWPRDRFQVTAPLKQRRFCVL